MSVPAEKLRPFTRLAYGAGELGPAMAGSTMIFFQLVFLTNVAGLRADLAGTVLLIGKIWDAVNDPFIGWLSDHTRTRWGRRLPWIAASALPFALVFWLQWIVPGFISQGNQLALFFYYAAVSLAFNTCYTGLILPHNALTPELSADYDERSRITGFRMAFSLGGSVGGLLLALVVFRAMAGAAPTAQYAAFGACVSAVALVAVAFCLAGIWRTVRSRERHREAAQPAAPSIPLLEQFGIVFANRPFLIVCAIYLFSWMAMQFTATILPFFVESCMGMPGSQFQSLALTVQATALALIPAWGWLSVRVGKKPVYFYGMAFWLVAQAGLVFVRPGQTSLMYLLGFIAGFGISVCYLIPNAMLPDTIEYDELRTGQRREGVFYGFFVFLQKIALAFGTFIVGHSLAAAGYLSHGPHEPVPVQPESALTAIRIAIGPLPAVALLLGMFFAWRFPITKAKHAEILRKLAARHREGRADPLH
ncbi:MAG: MFS transporter [Terrimicrobiaceae bacterium]|nr:MFS transporter [Terrimicrobiaceae bacterium]